MGTSAAVKGRMAPRTNTTIIGAFFETAVAKLLSCNIAEYGQPLYADIYNEALSFRVEVKSRDDKHPFGLRLKQKQFYEENNLSFPEDFNHTLYALVTYRRDIKWVRGVRKKSGRRSNHYVSRLSLLKTEPEKYELLARQLDTVRLLDIDAVTAMQNHFGTGLSSHPSHPHLKDDREITLGQGTLEKMFCKDNFADTLSTLGLHAREWQGASRKVDLEFDFWTPDTSDGDDGAERTYSAKFNLVTVLRKDFSQTLLRNLVGTRASSAA